MNRYYDEMNKLRNVITYIFEKTSKQLLFSNNNLSE